MESSSAGQIEGRIAALLPIAFKESCRVALMKGGGGLDVWNGPAPAWQRALGVAEDLGWAEDDETVMAGNGRGKFGAAVWQKPETGKREGCVV